MANRTKRRAFWVLGIVLLVGSVAGAGWLIQHPAAGAQENSPQSLADAGSPVGIIAHGLVDVKDGVRRLFPLQTGRVVWVAPEGKSCESDDVLLRLDNRLAMAEVERAKAALQESEARHEQAKMLPLQHDFDLRAQRAKVKAAEEYVTSVKKNREAKEATQKLGGTFITKTELDAVEALLISAKAKVTAEQAMLEKFETFKPALEVERALADANAKKADLDKADKAVKQLYEVRAPAKGKVLRVQTAVGELTGPQSPQVPVQFSPDEERIVRAEVMQDWAANVKVGQECEIQDEAIPGKRWKGRVTRVSDWFTHRRSIIQEPFQLNDVRTLECLVSIEGGADQLRIGQRLRVTIKQGGP
jgi:multidrug resistance efflux pump